MKIIINKSKNIKKKNFIIIKKTIKNFINNFNIQPKKTHLSLIFFTNTPLHIFNLNNPNYHNNKTIKNTINNLPNKLYNTTQTNLTLIKTHNHIFHPKQNKHKKPNILLILTNKTTTSKSTPYNKTIPPLKIKYIIHISKIIII